MSRGCGKAVEEAGGRGYHAYIRQRTNIRTDIQTNTRTNTNTKTDVKEGGPGRPVHGESLLTRFMKGGCVVLCSRLVGVWPPRSLLSFDFFF